MTDYIERLRQTVEPTITDAAAAQVVVDVVNAMTTVEHVMTVTTVDEQTRKMVFGAVAALTFGLAGNPFWQKNATYLASIVANSSMGWFAGFQHAQHTQSEAHKVLTLGGATDKLDIVTAVLYCLGGVQMVHDNAAKLKAQILEVKP